MGVVWPDGRKFAFTVVDDTDGATLKNVKPIYDLLSQLGFRTTKTAWMFPGDGPPVCGGATCEDPDYLKWLLMLRCQGFEIALHNAAPSTSERESTRLALTKFRQLFGPGELLFSNHTHCLENIYWGSARLSGFRRSVYDLVTLGRRREISRGHIIGDPLFWGDLCQEHVRYVRSFVMDELNALAICPEQPYHDPAKPYVNFWFTSTDAHNLESFLKNFTPERLKHLEEVGGLCIAYVHFASGFMENGAPNTEFRKRLEFLAGLNGWFVPTSQALDHLRQNRGVREQSITPKRLAQLEMKWLMEKLFKGTT